MFSLFKKKPPIYGEVKGQSFKLHRKRTILDSILDEGIEVPYSCQVGSCQKCLAKVTDGKCSSLVDLEAYLSPELQSKGYILSCQAVPESDLKLSFVNEVEQDAQFESALIETVETLSDSVSRITLKTALEAQVGQSLMVNIPALGQGRYYSVAGVDEGRISIDVAVKEQGICSPWLTDANNVNQTVELGQPEGKFGHSFPETNRCVAIAGGSALGVVLGIAEKWMKSGKISNVHLIHAVRYKAHSYDLSRLNHLKDTYPGFDFQIALSRENYEQGGFVPVRAPELLQNMFSLETAEKLTGTEHFLMCGSEPLINSCVELLKGYLVRASSIEAESFGNNTIDIR
ncbi:2Fe-2S iron-sulfur cluster-binding protein [Pseudoalteromonas rubra]|uniref:Uncharacterized protein n=1 Tax=Pseudoalteromonas rubra TaxID=43658 RepID=A0A0U3GLP9_9GAMM|nr:2Fe-2S iron-sulfur cluster-binding protein [Pseudoalteromonas rubra]ALU45818.1 hypothetical protein AT705_23100 [Pseudoalteromonas rubra]